MDAINKQPLVITVVVGTDAANIPNDYPTNVRVSARETGLPKDTVFMCFQIRFLDPSRFSDRQPVGIMPMRQMVEVENALRMTLGL